MTALSNLLACATCQPDPGSPLAGAASGAIYVMLGAMSLVFGGLLAMVISFVRRARATAGALADRQRAN
jgi:hypothetical protein